MTRLVFVLIAITVGLYALDVFLARMETHEVEQEAAAHHRDAQRQMQEHRYDAAVESFRRAYTLERKNPEYRLGLGAALTAAGRRDEARSILDEALREQPNSARANLLNARLLHAAGDDSGAAVYYHRAIYGAWTGDAAAQRIQVRLELIRDLAQHGDPKQLLAELLPLQAETQDVAVRRELAGMFITAGSPGRAADEYRTLLQEYPTDAALLTGLGDAELAAGRYGAAQVAFLRAYRQSPSNAAVRHGMELTSALTALDPTIRRLPSREKFERSTRILKLVRDALTACGVTLNSAASTHSDISNESAEQQLQQAEDLWRSKPPACVTPDLVNLIVEKFASQ